MAVSDGIGSLPQTRELFTAPGSLLGYDPYFQRGGIVGGDQSLFERAAELSRELSIPFVEALRRLREGSAETPAEGPTFGQTPTSWDPLGLEGYQAMQTSIPSLSDLFSSAPWSGPGQEFPTAGDLGGLQSTLMGAALPNVPGLGLASGAFMALASKAAEARAINRTRSRWSMLDPLSWGEAMTRGYPGFTDEDYAAIAPFSSFGLGSGMYTDVPALGETLPERPERTELGYAPGDRAWENYMDLQKNWMANPPPGVPVDPWTGHALQVALEQPMTPGSTLTWDQHLKNLGWSQPNVTGEWDPIGDPITGSYIDEFGQEISTTTADWNLDLTDPHPTVGDYGPDYEDQKAAREKSIADAAKAEAAAAAAAAAAHASFEEDPESFDWSDYGEDEEGYSDF